MSRRADHAAETPTGALDRRGPYKMRTITRLTGFSPAVLRAWERRFGLLQPARGSGGHRLYGDNDLTLLLRIRELLAQGRAIGEIANRGRDALLGQRPPARPAASDAATRGDVPTDREGSATGARVHAWRQRVVGAALELDQDALIGVLDDVFSTLTPERAVEDVVEPSARELGDLWRAGRCSVASEHLASEQFVHRLRLLLDGAQPSAPAAPLILAAGFPEEHHQLGLLVLAYRLARRGFRIEYLGGALPFADFEHACETTTPAAGVLSVTLPKLFRRHREHLIEMVRRGRCVSPLLVGGQGLPAEDAELIAAGAHLYPADAPLEAIVDHVMASAPAPRRIE